MTTIIDTHIHCYRHQDLSKVLDHLSQNMEAEFESENYGKHQPQKVAFFTNSKMDNSWHFILQLAETNELVGQWKFHLKNRLVIAVHPAMGEITLAPARQVNTKERLELLILGCDQPLDDDLPAEHYILNYHDENRIVCPWGVGKWLGRRGEILSALQSKYSNLFCLGDNGGRPWLWKKVPHFATAKSLGQEILNGSDPLPIDNELHRCGSYGIKVTSSDPSSEHLDGLTSIVEILKSGHISNYGALMGIPEFIGKRIKLSRT